MKSSFINNTHVEGYVFSHTLQKRVSKKGVTYIAGDINVATVDDFTNVVPVHFTYVTETFKSGKPNPTFELLTEIIESGSVKTAENCGKDALKVRIDGDVEVNDFVTREGEMASPKRVHGSFAHAMTNEIAEHPATFDVDMLIANVAEREFENDSYVTLRGYVFNFRGEALPVEFNVRSEGGMNYFLDQEVSNKNPMFTHIKGEIVSQAIVNETVEESAFGESIVRKSIRNLRTWDVTWAAVEPYEWDDDSTMTKKEFKQKLDEREEHLAEVKRNHDEYQASRNGGQNFAAAKKSPKVEQKVEIASDDEDDDDDEFPF